MISQSVQPGSNLTGFTLPQQRLIYNELRKAAMAAGATLPAHLYALYKAYKWTAKSKGKPAAKKKKKGPPYKGQKQIAYKPRHKNLSGPLMEIKYGKSRGGPVTPAKRPRKSTPANSLSGIFRKVSRSTAHNAKRRLTFRAVPSSSSTGNNPAMPRTTRRNGRSRPRARRGRSTRRPRARTRALRNATGYGGRFKSSKKVQVSKGMLHGSVRKYENGSAQVSNRCTYLGHSSAQYRLIHQTVWETMVRLLLREEGRNIGSMDDQVGRWIRITWFKEPDTFDAMEFTDIDAKGSNLLAAADGLSKLFYAQVGPYPDFVVDSITSYFGDPTSLINTAVEAQAEIQLKQMQICIKSENVLRIQNRTAASSGVDTSNSNEVSNNPLVGKVYHGYKGGFIPIQRPDGALALYRGMVPNAVGIIQDAGLPTVNNTGNAHLLPITMSKPPNPNFFKYCKRYSRVYIAPGQTKSSKAMHTWKGSVLSFMNQQRALIQDLGAAIIDGGIDEGFFQQKGESFYFGLERLVDTRSGEPDITIGYQYAGRVSTYGKIKKYNYVPEVTVDIGNG